MEDKSRAMTDEFSLPEDFNLGSARCRLVERGPSQSSQLFLCFAIDALGFDHRRRSVKLTVLLTFSVTIFRFLSTKTSI
jgi:hypothetical protein